MKEKYQIKNNRPIKTTIEYLKEYIYIWSLKVDASELKLINFSNIAYGCGLGRHHLDEKERTLNGCIIIQESYDDQLTAYNLRFDWMPGFGIARLCRDINGPTVGNTILLGLITFLIVLFLHTLIWKMNWKILLAIDRWDMTVNDMTKFASNS